MTHCFRYIVFLFIFGKELTLCSRTLNWGLFLQVCCCLRNFWSCQTQDTTLISTSAWLGCKLAILMFFPLGFSSCLAGAAQVWRPRGDVLDDPLGECWCSKYPWATVRWCYTKRLIEKFYWQQKLFWQKLIKSCCLSQELFNLLFQKALMGAS